MIVPNRYLLWNSRILFYAFIIIFRILLDISYSLIISVNFQSVGFEFSYSWFNYLVSWVVFLASLFLINDRLIKVSDYFFSTAVLGVLIPLCVLYGLDSQRGQFPLLITFLVFFIINIIIRLKAFSFKSLPTVNGGGLLVIFVSSFFVLFSILWYMNSGVSFNLDLSRVYEYRKENEGLAMKGIFAYLINWTYLIFNITLLAFSLMYRKFFLMLIVIGIQIYFFAASAHKTVLFIPILIIGLWYYVRRTNSLVFLPIILSFIVVFSISTYYLYEDLWASSILIRRVFLVPANLTYLYFDFFKENPYIFWSNSVLSSFLTYPYDVSLSSVIGLNSINSDTGANNGFISTGYAHAGLFGVFLYTFIVAFLLRFLNDITKDLLPVWFATALVMMPMRSFLISSDLLTTFFTHGLIVSLIIIFLVRTKKYGFF